MGKLNYKLINVSLGLMMIAVGGAQAIPVRVQKEATVTQALKAQSDSANTCPEVSDTPESFSMTNEDSETPFVDESREIKDLATEIVVKEFFRTPDTLFKFLKLVYTKIDGDLKKYRAEKGLDDRSILFLFKGGNVLRMLAHGIFDGLPPEARDIFKEAYEVNFKRSDSDFGVFIDPQRIKDLDYETVMSDLIKITYNALDEIRETFNANPETYFNFLQLSRPFASTEILRYFERLPDLSIVKDENNKTWSHAKFFQMQLLAVTAQEKPRCIYNGQYDYEYRFEGDNKGKIVGFRMGEKPNWIKNTINTALEFSSGNDPNRRVKFNLVRSKVQFEVSYEKDGSAKRVPIGGELIDVSFPHKDDFSLRKFLDHYEEGVADYELISEDGLDSFTLKSESFEGLVADLRDIILVQFERPWEASKYEKRVNRLAFLYFVEIIKNTGIGSASTKQYIKAVDALLATLDGFYSLDISERKKVSRSFRNQVTAITEKWPQISTTNDFLVSLSKLVWTQLIGNPKDSDELEMPKFIELLKNNLLILKKINALPEQEVDLKNMYKVNIKGLL